MIMGTSGKRDIAGVASDADVRARYDASVRLSVAPMMDWTDAA